MLTEQEKAAIHEALKAVRRKEFDYNVIQTILSDEVQGQMKGVIGGAYASTITTGTGGYLVNSATNPSTASLKIGKQTLTEEDIETLKYNTKDRYSFK